MINLHDLSSEKTNWAKWLVGQPIINWTNRVTETFGEVNRQLLRYQQTLINTNAWAVNPWAIGDGTPIQTRYRIETAQDGTQTIRRVIDTEEI